MTSSGRFSESALEVQTKGRKKKMWKISGQPMKVVPSQACEERLEENEQKKDRTRTMTEKITRSELTFPGLIADLSNQRPLCFWIDIVFIVTLHLTGLYSTSAARDLTRLRLVEESSRILSRVESD
ncbi:hypothetical protein K435DRAFT_805091 [Dendrothele bispora CBS 962.96]|uniref:Uncharacterized protein n=1 Tax=Dendrothele bispora (strain CBS 962.96) TaxID=1314807 RepID=A0A4V4HDB3_DENBC|nr:hypothetical protein K435DRAFT_805091 [Dendrothele bispora CBS 962.96]